MKELYPMIFKRRSFHRFQETEKITDAELNKIREKWKQCIPLVDSIQTEMKLVLEHKTTSKRGGEYCVLLYSEKKDHYLQNIGYLGEQLDLSFASMDIGVLWYGIGKTEEVVEGMEFVIMLVIAKMAKDTFRNDMWKSKRKSVDEIWRGEAFKEIGNIVRFAPSACNTQPWMVEANSHELIVYRNQKDGKRGIMPKQKVTYYNQIDIGIFLCFLEICLKKEGYTFTRTLFPSNMQETLNLTAVYRMECNKK